MDAPFLGNGWPFPILPDATGKLAYVAGDDNVEQSLEVLLMTQLNERVMRPTFGCDAPSYVFAPGSVQFLNLLEESVSDALTMWEPRVNVLSVDAEANSDDPSQVTVSVSCRVRDQLAAEPGIPLLPGHDRGTVMALAPVVLDDLTWSDFSTAAIQRIPAASAGLWTLNAPVDPGITLLDLFGWLLEQRLYWMDQVSNPLNRALFALLGITPNQAVAATTVLYIEPNGASGETSGAVLLPLGTQVQLANGQSPPVFTTLEAVTIFPLADAGPSARFQAPLVTLMVGTNDRSVNLAQGRSPALLDPDGGDTQIVLSFSSAASGSAGGTLALFFELLTPPGLATGWSPNAPTGPPGPNALTWLVTVNGTLTPLDSGQVVNGTLSLRRSGVVVLTIPSGWTVEPNTTADFAVVLRSRRSTRSRREFPG